MSDKIMIAQSWYFKQVRKDLSDTFSINAGVSQLKNDAHAFIQISPLIHGYDSVSDQNICGIEINYILKLKLELNRLINDLFMAYSHRK